MFCIFFCLLNDLYLSHLLVMMCVCFKTVTYTSSWPEIINSLCCKQRGSMFGKSSLERIQRTLRCVRPCRGDGIFLPNVSVTLSRKHNHLSITWNIWIYSQRPNLVKQKLATDAWRRCCCLHVCREMEGKQNHKTRKKEHHIFTSTNNMIQEPVITIPEQNSLVTLWK